MGALFLRYAAQVRLPLPAGVRAFLKGDTRPVVPEVEGRCQREGCRGYLMALADDEEPCCLLCGRTAGGVRQIEEPEPEATLAHYR